MMPLWVCAYRHDALMKETNAGLQLKGKYREKFSHFFTFSCRYMYVSIKKTPESLFSKTFFQEIHVWAVLKAYFKLLPVWVALCK